MSKQGFEYYGPEREPLCGKCVDKLYGDVHAVGGKLADGRLISWQKYPENPLTCTNCGALTVREVGFGPAFDRMEEANRPQYTAAEAVQIIQDAEDWQHQQAEKCGEDDHQGRAYARGYYDALHFALLYLEDVLEAEGVSDPCRSQQIMPWHKEAPNV